MVWPKNYREVSREANRARTAIENANWEGLRYCGNRFERGQYYREAWKALAAGVEGKVDLDRPVWPGPRHPCKHLLVLQRSRDLGDELRIIRFVDHATRTADKVTALVEPRLIPLLSRSFPKVDSYTEKVTSTTPPTAISLRRKDSLTGSAMTIQQSKGPSFRFRHRLCRR